MVHRIRSRRTWADLVVLAALVFAAPFIVTAGRVQADVPITSRYIVSDEAGSGASLAASDVNAVGGVVDENLDAADAVLAELTPPQITTLQQIPTVSVTPDSVVSMASTPGGTGQPSAVYPQQSGATQLWSQGDSGSGVNVAVVDTGIDALPDFAGRLLPGVDLSGEGSPNLDSYGHGTFVAGLIAGNGATSGGLYKGEAPGAGLVPVKVAGASGQTDIATIIAGVSWVIAHQSSEHIGVLNLSLGSVPAESTLLNPLDQAVQRAWQSGIVVVVAAGNDGPFNGTILAPADDPLVISVGAVDDHGSSSNTADTMSEFSAAGPTDPDGWIKPDIVTSGTSVVSLSAPGSTIATQNPSASIGNGNFVGSGTSFSSAITSGAVALLLADHPHDQPDDVKAALLGTASPGPVGNPLVDGHGILDVAAAASANGLHLTQQAGQVDVTQSPLGSNAAFGPGASLAVGYGLQVPGSHAATTLQLTGGELDVPVACTPNGSVAGYVSLVLPSSSYQITANANGWYPSGSGTAPNLQGTGSAPDLCNGEPMFPDTAGNTPVQFTGSLASSGSTSPATFHLSYALGNKVSGTSPNVAVTPVTASNAGSTIDLGTTWSESTWNGAKWSGAKWSTATWSSASWSAAAWDGTSWNGAVWNLGAWDGAKWSGAKWSGAKWSGAAWDGAKWSGSAWTGAKWSGAKWSGGSWNSDPLAATVQLTTPPSSATSSLYPGYQLVSTSPDLWCPVGVNLGHAGSAGVGTGPGSGAGGGAGAPGCGSNGGNGGNGGHGDAEGGVGGSGGSGGAGGCPASSDAQMAAGQYPCDGSGANGGNGGSGGDSHNGVTGGAGGAGGQGGNARGAQGGNGGGGGSAQTAAPGGAGGAGGAGGGCVLYSASYWVSCPSNGGKGGQGGQGGGGAAGGKGGFGGSAGWSLNTNGGNGGSGGSAANGIPGSNGQAGTNGGSAVGAAGSNGANGANG